MEANTKMRDMTQGSTAKHIFLFSLPLLLGNVLQQLYNMVDSWTVGNFTGDTALGMIAARIVNGRGWLERSLEEYAQDEETVSAAQ